MTQSGRHSLYGWFGVSLALHAGLAIAVWQTEFAPTSSPRAAANRVVVSLVARPTSEAIVPSAVSAPPVSNPTSAEPSLPKPEPKESSPRDSTPDSDPASTPDTPNTPSSPEPMQSSQVAIPEPVSAEAEAARSTKATAGTMIDPIPDYVTAVRARIDSKKRYPAMARRRSEEGLVLARLSIASSGQLEEVEVSGSGPILLRRATRAAVERAAPFPIPPRGPIVIEVPIRWRVRH